MKRLQRKFFERGTEKVARELLGKILEFRGKRARITETEAYLGERDPAAHAARKKTKYADLFWGRAGMGYVFLNYGVHWCLNVMTERTGKAGCVLIRGVEGVKGPGRVTKWYGITGRENGEDVTKGELCIWDDGWTPVEIKSGPRVGISKAVDWKLRFWYNA